MDIVELYVIIDDFCKKFMPKYLNLLKNNDLVSRNRNGMLNIYTIYKLYHINKGKFLYIS